MTVARVWTPPWYDGLTSRPYAVRTIAPTALPVDVAYVRDQVLRVASGFAEDAHIERLIKAAAEMCEYRTREALMPQTWQVRLSGFPSAGRIVLPRPPLISVDSIAYVDGDGADQSMDGSPSIVSVTPSGPVALASIRPLVDEAWPATQAQADAVVVTFQAGYASAEDVPDRYITGILLMVAELYKQRSLSVQNTIQNVPAVLQVDHFWPERPAWV